MQLINNLGAKSPCFFKNASWEKSHHIWRNSQSSLCFIKTCSSEDEAMAFTTLFIITSTYFFPSHHFMSFTTCQFLICCRIYSLLSFEILFWSHVVILSLSISYSFSTLLSTYTVIPSAVTLYFKLNWNEFILKWMCHLKW